MSGILNTIILFGALQGLIISCLLFFLHNRRQADRFLGMLIFLLMLASVNVWLNKQGWFQSSGLFQTLDVLIPMVIIMPVGPLLYFYQRAVLDPEFVLRKKQRLHFAPVLIDLVPSITCIGFILGILTGLVANRPGPVGEFIDTYNIYADIPRWLSVSVYLAISVYQLRQYRNQNMQTAATGAIKWLRQLQVAFIVFQCISLCYLLPYVLPAYTNKMVRIFYWYPIYVPIALLIYWLSIKGYLQRQQPAANKTNRQSMPSGIVEKTIKALEKAMETDFLYLDSDLNLSQLSLHTGIPVKTVSAVLNQHLQVSFSDFVNRYRVADFVERYQKPENAHLTIIGIASDCGFSSQPTFQRAFKQVTGMSPKDFKQSKPEITIKTVL